jgi:hypothetical protein
MFEQPGYDRQRFEPETGVSTGDARENDPRAAGFTEDVDQLFRSHFQHVNRLADRSYDQVRTAYQLGYAAAIRNEPTTFEEVETELANGWLNVRTAHGDWATVREMVRVGFERGRMFGRVDQMTLIGTTASHSRESFSDPLPKNVDPTSPASLEQTLDRPSVQAD